MLFGRYSARLFPIRTVSHCIHRQSPPPAPAKPFRVTYCSDRNLVQVIEKQSFNVAEPLIGNWDHFLANDMNGRRNVVDPIELLVRSESVHFSPIKELNSSFTVTPAN